MKAKSKNPQGLERQETQVAFQSAMSRARAVNKAVAAQCRSQVLALVNSLPGAQAVPAGGRHLSLEVRGRRFGWFLEDHHGDGRLALNLKAPRGTGQRLAAEAPGCFHVPKHIGHHGWIGAWLDSPTPVWSVIKTLLEEAYCLAAPKRLREKFVGGP